MSGLLDIFDFEYTFAPSDGILEQKHANHHKSLPPEVEEGNVEYKLKLINPTPNRLQQLITQMRWRLKEGGGKAVYELGVSDNGEFKGLSQSETEKSLSTLSHMAKRSGAKIDVIREKVIHHCRESDGEMAKVLEVLVVKKIREEKPKLEVRVIMLGNVDSGKSSLLGVLTQGDMDDGRGRARINLFRHQHELQSGRTSSISKEILGIDAAGLPINYSAGDSQEICDKSKKLIVFIDSGGHPKYLKTTVFTMTAMHADYAILVVDPFEDLDCETNRLHLNLALALELPILVVINKIDLHPDQQIQDIIARTQKLISSTFFKNKNSIVIRANDDIKHYQDAINPSQQNPVRLSDLVPIFLTSCVTGTGIELFQKFLHLLKPSMSVLDKKQLMKRKTIFQVDETFRIPSVGLVVSGFLASGRLKAQDVLKAGPLKDGSFIDVEVAGLQRHKVSRKFVVPGETSTLALKSKNSPVELENLIRRGMCLLSRKGQYQKNVSDHFSADIFLMPKSEPLTIKSQVMVYCENVRQRATVIYVQNDSQTVQPNETASIIVQFNRQPEYLDCGNRLLLLQPFVNAVGRITCLNPICPIFYEN